MKTHIKKALLLASLIIFVIGNSVNVVSVKANDITIPIGEVPKVYNNQGYIIFEISTANGPYTILHVASGGFTNILVDSNSIDFYSKDYSQKTYLDTNQDGTWDYEYDRQGNRFDYEQVVTAYYYSTCDVTDNSGALVFQQPHWMGHTRAVKATTVSWMALLTYLLGALTKLVIPSLVLAIAFRKCWEFLLTCL